MRRERTRRAKRRAGQTDRAGLAALPVAAAAPWEGAQESEERIANPKPAEDRPPDFTFDLLIQLRVRPQMRFGPFEVFYER